MKNLKWQMLCLAGLSASQTLGASLRSDGFDEVPGFGPLLDQLEQAPNSSQERRQLSVQEFLDKVEGIVAYIPYDLRFDHYSMTLSVANSLQTKMWNAPTAADVSIPVERKDVESVTCGLAQDIQVPKEDEHWEDIDDVVALTGKLLAEAAPFPDNADECGEWKEGEDKVKVIQDRLFEGDFSNRILVPWGPERSTDEAIKQVVFDGIGQHRVERVRAGDTNAQTPNGPAKYAVYLDFASSLETKPGMARLGANAYFDAQGTVLSIVRGGKTYTPQGEQGSEESENCFRGPWYWPFETCQMVPPVIGWKNARMAFLSTLNAVITGIDHLYELHLVVANSIVTANVEELEPEHPVRRLMTPFGFRTEAINHQAAIALTNEFGLVHRAFPFTVQGQKDLYAFSHASLKFKTVPDAFAAQNIDPAGMKLALHEDGLEYYDILLQLVETYLGQYYDLATPSTCAADADLARWYARINSMMPNHDLPSLNCDNLKHVMASFMMRVSAMHNHVGSIGAELRDPCFMPWSFREGQHCGMPRTFYTQAVTMGLTSLDMPKILDDYTHLLPKSNINDNLWTTFTAQLEKFGTRVDQRNFNRPRPFRTFDVKLIETAIGI